jgi:hypothetical protein
MRDDFAVFILSHGRADSVSTAHYLKRQKYDGRTYIVVDDGDAQLERYREVFGADAVLVFSKAEVASRYDEADNFNDRRSVFYARNACWDLARGLGLRYFLQLDDDYHNFSTKFNRHREFVQRTVPNVTLMFEAMLEYLIATPALSIAMSQGADHIGGAASIFPMRKAMNTFFCDVQRPFSFLGRINEDVSTYTATARQGGLFLTIPAAMVHQYETQRHGGGMTDVYLASGTYVKSFYSVMFCPSSVKIGVSTAVGDRIHHNIKWRNTIPQILPERWRKASSDA